MQSVRDEGATKADPYFTGLPTPAAACMMLLPLLVSFQWNGEIVRQPWVVLIMLRITSVLMVSRLPTPSIKYMRLQREHRLMAGFCGGLLAALLIAWPWATLTGALADLCGDDSGGGLCPPSAHRRDARRQTGAQNLKQEKTRQACARAGFPGQTGLFRCRCR